MTAGEIKFATHSFGAPASWDAEKWGDCQRLAVRVRSGTCESAWYPSAEELERLINGEPVILTIWGGQPAVSLNVNEGEK